MRVRFGNHIDLCKRVTRRNKSTILIITTIYDNLYTVECENAKTASKLYEEILKNGYADVSEFEYSN